MTKNNGTSESKEFNIPIKWTDNIGDIDTIYANQIMITHAQDEFFLVFGETFIGLIDPNSPPKEIKVKPVIKIAITQNAMINFEKIISGNIEKFKQKHKLEDKK